MTTNQKNVYRQKSISSFLMSLIFLYWTKILRVFYNLKCIQFHSKNTVNEQII